MPTTGTSSREEVQERRRRRRRGEPRGLILEAARDLFNRKGYTNTFTKDVAEQAGVSETLIFRYFQTKVGLFREAIVQPFVEIIDRWVQRPGVASTDPDISREDTRAFVSEMYDVFREHRALATLVFAPDDVADHELAETGVIDEVRGAVDRFVSYARKQAIATGRTLPSPAHNLAIRGHLAMVAGVATHGPWYFGGRRPSRKAAIDELSEWVWLRYNSPRAR